MADPKENLGVGGGPAPLGPPGAGPSFEDEEKAMKSGKGRMIVAMIVAVLLAVGLLVFLMKGDDTEQYRTFGRNVNGLEQRHFQQFWGCALRGMDLRRLTKAQDLTDQINRRAGQGQKRYTQLVNTTCMPKLADLKPQLDALIAPEDMRTQLHDLSQAAGAMRDAWAAYVAYMDGLQAPYDSEDPAAVEHVTKIAKGWYDYRRTHKAINDALRNKINN